MKRILVLLTAVIATLAVSGLGTAMADDLSVEAAPTPQSPIVWTGNGTTGGACNQIYTDPEVKGQVWLFILTSPSGSDWSISGEFQDSGTFGPIAGTQMGGGAIHFLVSSSVDDILLSAQATNGKTNSVLTVSHCTQGGDAPPPGTGSLSVVKTVVPLPDGVTGVTLPTSYTAHVSCTDETEVDVTLPAEGGAGDPAIIEGIADGATCTVVETSAVPAGTLVTYTPAGADTTGVTITEGENVEVNITNDFTAVEGEVVTKPVTPETPVASPVVVAPAFTG